MIGKWGLNFQLMLPTGLNIKLKNQLGMIQKLLGCQQMSLMKCHNLIKEEQNLLKNMDENQTLMN